MDRLKELKKKCVKATEEARYDEHEKWLKKNKKTLDKYIKYHEKQCWKTKVRY